MKYFSFFFLIIIERNIIFSLISDIFDESSFCVTWSTSNVKTLGKNFPPIELSNNSLRQIFRVSTSGEKIRVKFTNKYGQSNLEIKKVIISESLSQGTSEINPITIKYLTFNNQESKNIEAGEEIYSDVIEYNIKALSEIAISIFFGNVPSELTGHGNSISNCFIEEGDKINNNIFNLEYKTPHWYFIESIEVFSLSEFPKKAIVCFGDSITEGVGSTIDKNNRWPDKLAEKLQKNEKYKDVSVANAGIGGNRICDQGLERFDHDVLEIKGIKYIILLYGINDMIHKNTTSDKIISAYKKIIEKAHNNKLFIYCGTILPAGKYITWSKDNEINRQEVNDWIRNTKKEEGGFDNFFDFDKYLRDDKNETNLKDSYDSGDGLHPSPEGHKTISDIINDLDLFTLEYNEANNKELNIIDKIGVKFKLDFNLKKDENILIKINGKSKGSLGFRVYLEDFSGKKNSDYFYSGKIENGDFEFNVKLKCKEISNYIVIRRPISTINIDNIILNSIEVEGEINKNNFNPKYDSEIF